MLIDATLKHPMPPLALPAREFMEHARDDLEGAGPAGAHAAVRPGTAIRWAIGTSDLTSTPAARSRGDGRKAARKHSNGAAAA